jgi:thiamine biosynthesis lipoprotein ApbE
VLGTALELRLWGSDPAAFPRAESAVISTIHRLARVFSTYDPNSEFMRWQQTRGQAIPISPELFEVLNLAGSIQDHTGGAFEPRIAALSRLWNSAAQSGQLPRPDDLAALTRQFAQPPWSLDAARRTATRWTDLPLTLDAIAKGYIVEKACAAALAADPAITGVLVNLGGDLRAQGRTPLPIALSPPRGDHETAPPVAWIQLQNRSVATSNAAHRGFQIGNHWYSHILDPRTGQPAERIASATVVAPSGALADALATAFNLLEPASSLRVAASFPHVECRITTSAGQVLQSPGWAGLESAPPPPQPRAQASPAQPHAQAQPFWGDSHELAIAFTINRGTSAKGPYRRPYVVIWVEDEQGNPVRTILLWVSLGGSGPMQWLPDLRRWYTSGDEAAQVRHKNMIYTSARSTRPPGRYEAAWDGKDDAGNPLPPGKFTIYIEAAREHGTYQMIRHTLAMPPAEPFQKELPGGEEIQSATLEFRPRKTSQK